MSSKICHNSVFYRSTPPTKKLAGAGPVDRPGEINRQDFFYFAFGQTVSDCLPLWVISKGPGKGFSALRAAPK